MAVYGGTFIKSFISVIVEGNKLEGFVKVITCPSLDELTSFRNGRLALDRHFAIARHAKTCAICRQVLVGIVPSVQPIESTPHDIPSKITVAEQPVPATRIGPFRLIRILGQGGMGVVYEAEHEKLKTRVALKILPTAFLEDPVILKRFRREWEAVGRLVHPNVVRALHADDVDGIPYLAMEYIDGPDIGTVIHRHGALSSADAAAVIRQAAFGLAHAHSQGVIHRDVKPTNLLLGPDGAVKLLDLGLARLTATAAESFTTGKHFLGTADYMAPEQWDGTSADERTDLYALGCVFFFVLTGKAPFGPPDYESPRAKMQAHRSAMIPTVPGAPDVIEVMRALLAKRPEDRPRSALDVAEALSVSAMTAQLDRLALTVRSALVGAYADGDATRPVPRPLRRKQSLLARFWQRVRGEK